MTEKNDGKACAELIISLIIVGTVGVLRRYIPLSSPALAFFRGAVGAASLLLFALLSGKLKGNRPPLKKLALLLLNGAFLSFNWMLLFEAFNYTTRARETLCYYMAPTIVLLLSPVFFRERLTRRRLICAFIALCGMVLVSGVLGSGETGGDIKGVLYGLGAACLYALVVIINKKLTGVEAYARTIIQLAAAAAVMLPYLAAKGGFGGVEFSFTLVLLLLVVGVIYTGLVYALYFGSMSRLKAQTISALSYIDPVTAMIVSAVILKERLTFIGIAGAVLIIGAALAGELWAGKAEKD